MDVVARLDQYASIVAYEFDETTANNPSITGLGTYYASEFSENVGISTTLTANVFPAYDPAYDEFGGTLFGPAGGSYMRQNTDKSVVVYNEINEIDPFGVIPTDGLQLYLDPALSSSYPGIGSTVYDLSGNGRNALLAVSSAGAISYVTGTSHVATTTGSFTLSGIQANDLIIVAGASDNGLSAIPTGFTEGFLDNGQAAPGYMWAYKFATGTSETISGLDFGTASDAAAYIALAFRNVDTTNPFDVVTTSGTGTGTSIDPPAITTVSSGAMIVTLGMLDDDNVADTSSLAAPTNYTLGPAEDVGTDGNDVSGATVMSAYRLLTNAGTENPSTFTFTTGDDNWASFTIALKGTPTDLPTYSSTNEGEFIFNGINQYGYVPSYKGVTGTGARSSILFFKTSSPNISPRLFGWGTTTTGNKWNMSLDATNYRVRVEIGGASVACNSGTQDVTDGNWHMVAATAPSSGTANDIKVYIDGNLITDVTITSGATAINTSSSADVSFAASIADISPGYLPGSTSGFLIYNRQLTNLEIQEIYKIISYR